MTLTYSLQIWNEDADLPSGESSTCEDDSTLDESFASARTTLDSACESVECPSFHTATVSSLHIKGSRAVSYGPEISPRTKSPCHDDPCALNGSSTVADGVSGARVTGPSIMDPAPESAPAPAPPKAPVPLVELNALKQSPRKAGSEEQEDYDGSHISPGEEESPPPAYGEELPPPDEVVGNDTTEWHEDYSDNSNQAESLGFLDDSSDSQCDLSTMWDVPSFDQDSEWDGDPDADSGWDSLPSGQKSPELESTNCPSKHHTVPPEVMNMFKKSPTTTCDSAWHSHADVAFALRRNSSLSARASTGVLTEDLSRHGNNYRPWPPSSLFLRSPFSTLDTIQESNSRSCSPLLAVAACGVRPRSRSHSSRRQTASAKQRLFRCRSGSATGRLECSPHTFLSTRVLPHEAWSHAAWSLDEDTRRVLARFQGFRPSNQTQQDEEEEEVEINVLEEQSDDGVQAEEQDVFAWPPGKIGSPDDKSSRLCDESVLVDESLLSSKDRARYRRHLRRMRLSSARYLDYASDSDDPSDTEEKSTVTSSL